MVRLVLLRHGQTEWNRVERFRGRIDLDLDETGLRQAEATARRLAPLSVSAVYASPLKRAWCTAEAIATVRGLQVQALPGLIDADYGAWQGLSPEEVAQRDGQRYAQWLESPHQVQFPGGESLPQVQMRARAAVDEALARHPDQTVAMVTHKVVCKLLALSFLRLDASHFWKIEQDVCALNLFEFWEGRAVTVKLNDTCHLKGL